MKKYILSFDQGTTSSRAIVFDHSGSLVAIAQKEFTQIFPQPGWVEHDAREIWTSQVSVAAEAVLKAGLQAKDIATIGITNQRETTLVWNRKTGEPVCNAIVWQDRRTAAYCDSLKQQGLGAMIQEKTGLVIDAYFSASKIWWILENVAGAREDAQNGLLAFGTVDSWLIWNLTSGETHVTDVTNASRTLLYNINTLSWDDELLKLFGIPASMLPEVKPSSGIFGHTSASLFAAQIPIGGVAGDQQAALFGQLCTKPGMVKNTYGTGCFMLMNIGDKPILSKHNLVTTIAWQIDGKVQYALEGSIFIAGAVVQWLRDGLGIIRSSSEIEKMALQAGDNQGVYFVPAFAGLGAPHWNQHARGTIFGITRGTTKNQLARAGLESIAYQTMDVLRAMQADSGIEVKELRVDGGATINNMLMEFQADIIGTRVIRPKMTEVTAMGAAYLAGLAVGYWDTVDDIQKQWKIDRNFEPRNPENRSQLIAGWHKAVRAVTVWAEEP